MKGNFVSDISGILLNYYDNKEFEKIKNVIGDEITKLTGSNNYDSAYRLQQDIAFLNTNLLTTISKYINTNVPSTNEEKINTQKDTFKAQTKSSKINLSYKYFYLLIKLIVIILLLGAIYFYFFRSSTENPGASSFLNYGKNIPP